MSGSLSRTLIALLVAVGLAAAACNRPPASAGPPKVKDVVCGMDVEPGAAGVFTAVHDGKTHYFCSLDCVDTFKKNPAKFLTRTDGGARPQMPPARSP